MASLDCLDPDTAASYAANALDPNERERVEQHIDGCASCRELVSLVAKAAWSTQGTTDSQKAPTVTQVGGPPVPRRKAADTLPRGTRIGPFDIVHPLSAGGMGMVYVGYDARLDRQVALKCVRDHSGDNAQLLTEAKLMAQLAHPNVVPVYDVIDAHGQVFIAMELVVGRTLRQWIQAAPRTWRALVDVFIEAGIGLAAAHAIGMVHGDVKPGNVLVGDDGRVRVTDFGLAGFASDGEEETTGVRGTPAYFAPEQLRGQTSDTFSDQYAFAVSLHEALYGALPGTPPTRKASVPAAVRRALTRALSTARKDRFPSMAAFNAALRSARLQRGRWVLAGATFVSALTVLSFTVGGRRVQAEQCNAAAQELASGWTADARERTRQAFARTGLSYAADTLNHVETNLDAWQLAFDRARTSACDRGVFSRDVPLQRFTRQLTCLKAATRESRALVTQLLDADQAVVLHAVAASQQLPSTEVCGDAAPQVAVAASTPQLSALQETLAHARALVAAGRYKEGLKLGREATAAAAAAKDASLLAAAKATVGEAQSLLSDYDEAAKTLSAAIELAEVAQEDRARALAWNYLLGVEYSLGHQDTVAFLGPQAMGAAERHRRYVRLETEVMITRGSSLSEQGKVAEAKAMLEEAVRRRAAAYGEQDRRTSMALSTLANAYAMNGELSPAIAAHQRALVAAELSFPEPVTPKRPSFGQNLADDYLYGLKGEEAVAELQKSVSTLRAANGPHNREVVMGMTDLGLAYLVSGHSEKALEAFESANAEWAATFPKHPIRAAALLGRYNALAALGRPGSKEDLELALKLGGELPPFELGRVQLALGMAKNDVALVKAAEEEP